MSESTPDKPALICIPDISGFTRFIAENNIDFSRKIIPPLLRKMVNSNAINLQVGEIEGDAVVFYRFGDLPSLEELATQCKAFYINFSEQLNILMEEHADDFHKNLSSSRLSLKIVVHAAVMTSTEIKGHTKLLGEDVVVAHKLLKNSVKEQEYVLLTEKFLAHYTEAEIIRNFSWGRMHRGSDEYEFIGRVEYRSIALANIAAETANGNDKGNKEKSQ